MTEKKRVSTGLRALDQRLDGLFIGDNVIWYDEAGAWPSLSRSISFKNRKTKTNR
jgi:hypothetical protein